MPLSNRISLSLASTAAVALAALPLAASPASAARVTEGTISSIGVIEASSNAQQFNLRNLGVQASSTGFVARRGGRSDGLRTLPGFLQDLLEFLGFTSSQANYGGKRQ